MMKHCDDVMTTPQAAIASPTSVAIGSVAESWQFPVARPGASHRAI
jgi:hypothetical protein